MSIRSLFGYPAAQALRCVFLPKRAFGSKAPASSLDDQEDMPLEMENPFKKEKAKCILCSMNIRPDYKNTRLLAQFVSPYTGRVYGRHITGLCKTRQAQVVQEITKAQNAGFMPYYLKEPLFLKDPKLFNPERPFRPHDY